MQVKKFLSFAAYSIIACCSFGTLQADDLFDDLHTNVVITNGYRSDKINLKLNSAFHGLLGDSESESESEGSFSSSGSDNLRAKKLNIYQLGLKADWKLCNWILRLDGDYGWGSNGRFHLGRSEDSSSSNNSHRLEKIRVADFTLGVGYLFTFCSCEGFAIGPVAGWSYDYQRFQLKHRNEGSSSSFSSESESESESTSEFAFLNSRNGGKYKQQWQGPWLGFDLTYDICQDYGLKAGYEYHWAHFHASTRLDNSEDSSVNVSRRLKGKNGSGNVVYINGFMRFWCDWTAGLGFKYDYFTSRRHNNSSSGSGEGSFSQDIKLRHAKWDSYQITLDLGYVF